MQTREIGQDQQRYALFCRAIDEGDSDAWAEIVTCYRSLLISWAYRCVARTPIQESCEDIADQAFARAWMSLSSSGIHNFPNLATLLGYLRNCVSAVVIDQARSQSARTRMLYRLDLGETPNSETAVLQDLDRAEIWELLDRVVTNEQERIVLYERIVLDLPSRAIQRRHPEKFLNVEEVYQTRRSLFSRLRRNPELQRLYLEYEAA